jgi:hypothetical protein
MTGCDNRQPRAWLPPTTTAALLLVLISIGCGTGGATTPGKEAKPDSYAVAHGETIEDCLIEVGVQFAVLPRDLAFFETARAAGDVAEGGSAYDDLDKVPVRLLVSRKGGAKDWMLWYSEPSDPSRGPEYLVRHLKSLRAASAAPVFVAFKVKPKLSFRKEIRRCVRFPLSPS